WLACTLADSICIGAKLSASSTIGTSALSEALPVEEALPVQSVAPNQSPRPSTPSVPRPSRQSPQLMGESERTSSDLKPAGGMLETRAGGGMNRWVTRSELSSSQSFASDGP